MGAQDQISFLLVLLFITSSPNIIMVKVAFATLFAGAAAGGDKLAITWEDCGDANTHAKITDVEPTEITIGSTGDLTGTGTIDEEVTDGSFTIKMTASLGIKVTFTGNICEAKTFNLPLNLGSVSWAGMDCPVAAGPVTAGVAFTTASVIPAGLATADIAVSGLDQNGEPALCISAHLAKEFLTEADCTGAACPDICTCAYSKCSSDVNACLANSACASGQACVMGCACGDTACAAQCAAASGSSLATSVLQCISSSCSSMETVV